MEPARWKAATGLLICITLPFIPLGKWIAPGGVVSALLVREAVWWVYLGVVIVWLLRVEGQSLASIGFRRPTWKTFAYGTAGAFAVLTVTATQYALIVPLFHLNAAVAEGVRAKMMATPFFYRVLIVLRAAVVEEILFRAYLIEKVRQLTGSWGLALILSVVAFTLAHLSGWGVVQLIPVFGAAVVLGALYVCRRDTAANIITHFITDAAGFLLG
jgi:membrane protease YdiL (CAAX protease family)